MDYVKGISLPRKFKRKIAKVKKKKKVISNFAKR